MDFAKLTAGENAPEEINVFIEIPQGSLVKYELDKETGVLMVDRFQHTALGYPFNYGFIPGTHAADGDSADVLLISSLPVQAGVMVKARPIGVLAMEDEAGIDNKILAVPLEKIDPFMSQIQDAEDLNPTLKARIKHFFDHYKELEKGKWVKTGEFSGKAEAVNEIKKALA